MPRSIAIICKRNSASYTGCRESGRASNNSPARPFCFALCLVPAGLRRMFIARRTQIGGRRSAGPALCSENLHAELRNKKAKNGSYCVNRHGRAYAEPGGGRIERILACRAFKNRAGARSREPARHTGTTPPPCASRHARSLTQERRTHGALAAMAHAAPTEPLPRWLTPHPRNPGARRITP